MIHCPNCNATLRADSESFCSYCGVALPGRDPVTDSDSEVSFEALKQSAEYKKLLTHQPSMKGLAASSVFTGGFLVVWVAGTVFMGLSARSMDAPIIFTLVPFGLAAVGALGLVGSLKKSADISGGKLERLPSLVSGKRKDEDDDGPDDYYMTLEHEGGRRKEYRVPGDVYGASKEDDYGVAFLKGGYLLEFQRVRL